MTVTVALLLAAVTVLPLLAEAHHAASGPIAHAVQGLAGPAHAADHQDADELIHHVQSHAQGVVPATSKAPATEDGATVAFAFADEAARTGSGVRGPFEPPRG
ncbi:hypothetical protein [Methylobacterium sp. sgz302541]|uniref:hypothetical protein n=1 Tax=unclassified Methylobacterium TaxID=2615210 RepID=UPI003D354383